MCGFTSLEVCIPSKVRSPGSEHACIVLLDIAEFPFRGVVTFCDRKIPVFPYPHQERTYNCQVFECLPVRIDICGIGVQTQHEEMYPGVDINFKGRNHLLWGRCIQRFRASISQCSSSLIRDKLSHGVTKTVWPVDVTLVLL